MTLLLISIDTKVAIASGIIAVFALIVSLWSGHVSKRVLRLSEKQYSDKLPDFELYFIEGFRFLANNNAEHRRLLLFQLTIKNKSELKNTLKAELELEYLREDDSFSKILLEHNPNIASLIKEREFSIYPTDIELDAKTANTKWLIFEEPKYITKSHRIEKYCMKIIDISGKRQLLETVLIKNVEE